MLKFLTVGAALAAVLNTQVNSSLLTSPENSTNHRVQASASNLVVTARTEFTNAQTSMELPDSSNTPRVVEQMDPATITLGLLALGSVAIAVNLIAKDAHNPFKSISIPYGSISKISQNSTVNTIRIEQASRRHQQKLLTLLHNDRDAANRLLSQVKMKNPNRSIDWSIEKVIYDLERDRGG